MAAWPRHLVSKELWGGEAAAPHGRRESQRRVGGRYPWPVAQSSQLASGGKGGRQGSSLVRSFPSVCSSVCREASDGGDRVQLVRCASSGLESHSDVHSKPPKCPHVLGESN